MIDVRPLILIAAIPILFVAARLYRRFIRPQATYTGVFGFMLFAFLAAYQFILYGPFIDQHRVISTPARWVMRNDLSPPKVAFVFRDLPFQGIYTTDKDVFAHVDTLKSDSVTVGVELFYDFGHVRGMNLAYASVDGILFRPEEQH